MESVAYELGVADLVRYVGGSRALIMTAAAEMSEKVSFTRDGKLPCSVALAADHGRAYSMFWSLGEQTMFHSHDPRNWLGVPAVPL